MLSICQAKTGRPLTLPLLPEVTEAVIAHLRDSRPTTTSRYVFVRHRAPFEPFVSVNNLASMMRGALRRAGLDQRPGRRALYLFRHAYGNRMLTAGCAMTSIDDALGHASTEAAMEGEFKGSSQHLGSEELQWEQESDDALIVQGAFRCGHSVVDRSAIHSRPRKTLAWKTPAEALDDCLCPVRK